MMTARAKLLKEIQAGTSSGTWVFLAGEPKRPKAGRLSMRYEVTVPPQTKLEPEYFFLKKT